MLKALWLELSSKCRPLILPYLLNMQSSWPVSWKLIVLPLISRILAPLLWIVCYLEWHAYMNFVLAHGTRGDFQKLVFKRDVKKHWYIWKVAQNLNILLYEIKDVLYLMAMNSIRVLIDELSWKKRDVNEKINVHFF